MHNFLILILGAAFLFSLTVKCYANEWMGPKLGPTHNPDKQIIFISQSTKNEGISAAYRGFQLAAHTLGWKAKLIDGEDNLEITAQAFEKAIASRPDAIVLGGFAEKPFEEHLIRAIKLNIVLVGWHAAAEPGPTKHLFYDLGTSPVDVAKMAASHITKGNQSKKIGVIIFNDSRFSIANKKTDVMKKVIEACGNCELLKIQDELITEAKQNIPKTVEALNHEFGRRWTHSLAINDAYFDIIDIPLRKLGRDDIKNVSAGDGSFSALKRIKLGGGSQIATVAEPHNVIGWQLADELNRAFSNQPPSGYIPKPILVTTEFFSENANQIDDQIPYAEAYKKIWFSD